MRSVLVLLRKDFINFFHNRAAFSLTFFVPFALIYVFGEVFGARGGRDSGPTGIPLAVVDASGLPGAARLVDALRAEQTFAVRTTTAAPDGSARPLTEADLRPLMLANAFRFALVIPADVIVGETPGVQLRIYTNPRNEIETQMVTGLLQRTIFTQAPQLLGQGLQAQARAALGPERLDDFNHGLADHLARTFGGDADALAARIADGSFGLDALSDHRNANATGGTAAGAAHGETSGGANVFSQLIRIETQQVAGQDVASPAATRIVGGFAIQFLLFAVSGSAAALFYERDLGLFERLLAGPVRRSDILWSKFLYGVVLGVLQLAVLFGGGRLLYGIDVEHHVIGLLVMGVFAAGACTAFGMLLASLVTTPEAASGLGTFVILLMCAVGGAWFPVSFMPETIQHLSRLTIVYWAVNGFEQVLWMDAPLRELLPTLAVLGGTTAAVLALAVWRFNRGRIFE